MKRAPFVHIMILTAFLANTFGFMPLAEAQEDSLLLAGQRDFFLPAPGVMVHLSPPLDPPMLKGIKVHPDNPFKFEFILDKGDSQLSNDALKNESSKLIKYFLASLTIPEKDLWVNLSPYEKDRIIPQSFGLTEMGRDLLAEDYMLKQITASLIYPEDEIGKKFWKRIYEEAAKKYGTTNIPVNTFNKVWIMPQKAAVYENVKAGTAYVVESKLKVMLEQDYLSLEKHEGIQSLPKNDINALGSQVVREIVIPELTIEVNENKNFAQLRQVYNSLILATWYKKKIKDSILEQVYADKNKVAGVNIDDPKEKERIYQKYLRAFKKGVFNYIKEDIDPATQETIPRKYFSGGVEIGFKIVDELAGKTIMRVGENTLVVIHNSNRVQDPTNPDHIVSVGSMFITVGPNTSFSFSTAHTVHVSGNTVKKDTAMLSSRDISELINRRRSENVPEASLMSRLFLATVREDRTWLNVNDGRDPMRVIDEDLIVLYPQFDIDRAKALAGQNTLYDPIISEFFMLSQIRVNSAQIPVTAIGAYLTRLSHIQDTVTLACVLKLLAAILGDPDILNRRGELPDIESLLRRLDGVSTVSLEDIRRVIPVDRTADYHKALNGLTALAIEEPDLKAHNAEAKGPAQFEFLGGERHGGEMTEPFTGDVWIYAGSASYRVRIDQNNVMFQPYKLDSSKLDSEEAIPMDVGTNTTKFFFVGASTASDYSFSEDPLLSRKHFSINVTVEGNGQGTIHVRDWDSLNGTRVVWTTPHSLASGERKALEAKTAQAWAHQLESHFTGDEKRLIVAMCEVLNPNDPIALQRALYTLESVDIVPELTLEMVREYAQLRKSYDEARKTGATNVAHRDPFFQARGILMGELRTKTATRYFTTSQSAMNMLKGNNALAAFQKFVEADQAMTTPKIIESFKNMKKNVRTAILLSLALDAFGVGALLAYRAYEGKVEFLEMDYGQMHAFSLERLGELELYLSRPAVGTPYYPYAENYLRDIEGAGDSKVLLQARREYWEREKKMVSELLDEGDFIGAIEVFRHLKDNRDVIKDKNIISEAWNTIVGTLKGVIKHYQDDQDKVEVEKYSKMLSKFNNDYPQERIVAISRQPTRGGIDLTSVNMNLQTKVIDFRDSQGIKFYLTPAMLLQFQNAPGFVPVIIYIQPVRNLKKFLGIDVTV